MGRQECVVASARDQTESLETASVTREYAFRAVEQLSLVYVRASVNTEKEQSDENERT